VFKLLFCVFELVCTLILFLEFKYFDQVDSGNKVFEYRDKATFYDKIEGRLKKEYKMQFLRFEYQFPETKLMEKTWGTIADGRGTLLRISSHEVHFKRRAS